MDMDLDMMDITAPSASIGDLPIELHEQIIEYLPWYDQLNCEHVCKVWREVIRGRYTTGRFVIAPWLPAQSYALDLYAPLQIHSLLVEGKTLTFKCAEKYQLLGSSYIVDESLINEIAGGLDEGEAIEAIECITSFKVTDKVDPPQDEVSQDEGSQASSDGSSNSQQSIVAPAPAPRAASIANLSILNDMVVIPSLVSEDQITKLYGRFTLMGDVKQQVPMTDEELASSGDQNAASGSTQQGTQQEATQAADQAAPQPANIPDPTAEDTVAHDTNKPIIPLKTIITHGVVSSGNLTCDVVQDNGITFSCLTLGKLLLHIRQSLVEDCFRREGNETETQPQTQEVVAIDPQVLAAREIAKAERKKALENAEIVVEGLHFVRGGGAQALTIVFNAEVITEGSKPLEII
ncbi:hypothetical protein ABW21_db0202054 [Orbilia brochopaga]|nr:hypothetical protein ABW21_db0202054 [Drechslerella brochopaga]